MSYSSNPLLPNARAQAVRLVVEQKLPLAVAARKSGIHRTTLWRWKRKWDKLNEHVQLTNDNRPTRPVSPTFRLAACTWRIPTLASRPHRSPRAMGEEIVTRVLELRQQLKRCAEVIWHHATAKEGLLVSLSSVRRILRRHHCFDGARKKRVRSDNPRRPLATKPGELVQTDTVHYVRTLLAY